MSRHPHSYPVRCAGFSLIELMVAMTIGVVLVLGATQVYVGSKRTYSDNETISRMEETARYALAIIEPDVRMANYWGYLKGASLITGQAAQTVAAAAIASNAAANICGTNFAADLNRNIQGDNNGYILSASIQPGCNTLNGWTTTPAVTADTLIVRRASAFGQCTVGNPCTGTVGALQICSTRTAASLINGTACTAAPTGQINNLIVNAYYIDQNSAQRAGMPALRRKFLANVAGTIAMQDQEVIPGIEDLQIQFGIDDPAAGTTGTVVRYVDPNAVPAGADVIAVRIWLLVREDTPESGFIDSRTYSYADRVAAAVGNLNVAGAAGHQFQPSLSTDASFTGVKHYRRLLVSRTIQIRNAAGT
jgi:type IV pilus assembly protein PilW